MRELPQLVQLHQRLHDRVTCISVSLDYAGGANKPQDLQAPILAMLDARDATCTNVLCSDKDSEVYDRLKLAAVPAVLVYDRDGKLRKRFDNEKDEYGAEGFNYDEHIVPLVEQLLAE